MQIDNKVYEKFQGFTSQLPGEALAAQARTKMCDRPQSIPLRRRPVVVEGVSIGDIDVMPWPGVVPGRLRADPIRPEPELRQTVALTETADLHARLITQIGLSHQSGDTMTIRTEAMGPLSGNETAETQQS